MYSLLHIIAVFLSGLLAGTFIGSALVEQAARRLAAHEWLAYKKAKEVVFGAIMPAFLFLTILACSSAAASKPMRVVFLVATTLLIGVLAITVVVHLPINKLVQGASPDAVPAEWSNLRRRWRVWNWVRCALAIAAFAIALFCFR